MPEDRSSLKELDRSVVHLMECQQLPETQVKTLCEKVSYGHNNILVTGTFVPFVLRNESSICGTFVPSNFRSQEPSFPGTFIPMSDFKGELTFPNISYYFHILAPVAYT